MDNVDSDLSRVDSVREPARGYLAHVRLTQGPVKVGHVGMNSYSTVDLAVRTEMVSKASNISRRFTNDIFLGDT